MTKLKSTRNLRDYRPRLDYREIQFLVYALRMLQEKAMRECRLQRRLEAEEYDLRYKAKMGCVPEFFVWKDLQEHLRKHTVSEHNLTMINEICIDLIKRLEGMLDGRLVYPRWLPEMYLSDLFSGTKNIHIL